MLIKKNMATLGILIVAFAVVLASAVYATHIPVQCNDGADNDLDEKIDFPTDNGCSSALDNTESITLGYAHGCLTNGDELKDVFGNTNYQCNANSCIACVLMTEAGNWTTLLSKCNNLPPCGFNDGNGGVGGNTTIDSQPPNLTINNPIEGRIYNSRTVLLDLKVDEKSDIYYTDLVNGRGRWTRVCSDCLGYKRTRSFGEGLNSIQFKASDVIGNTAYKNISFFIDSMKPRILREEPKDGFTSGDFSIQFSEDNPERLFMTYGDVNPGFNVHEIDIDNECQLERGRYYCDTHINLSGYDGHEILYWVTLTDIAGTQTDSKKHNGLDVDTTSPVINSLTNTINKRYVNFVVNVTEENFDEANYSYIDTNGRTREGRLCSRLKDGICEKKLSFRPGHFDVSIQVLDKAGNSVGQVTSFDVV